jgi:retron-type reverse transcriptase
LGIAALEDKVIQQGVVTVLNQIYEEDFKGFSYGFRPRRSPHHALDALWVGLMRKEVNWVLDADVRDFFGTVIHEHLVKFVEHRITDRRILRLIQKWLYLFSVWALSVVNAVALMRRSTNVSVWQKRRAQRKLPSSSVRMKY